MLRERNHAVLFQALNDFFNPGFIDPVIGQPGLDSQAVKELFGPGDGSIDPFVLTPCIDSPRPARRIAGAWRVSARGVFATWRG